MILFWCIAIPLIVCVSVLIVIKSILSKMLKESCDTHTNAVMKRFEYEKGENVDKAVVDEMLAEEAKTKANYDKLFDISNRIDGCDIDCIARSIAIMAAILLCVFMVVLALFRADYRCCIFYLEQYEDCVADSNDVQAEYFAEKYNHVVAGHKEIENSPWVSVFCDERIAEMKYINYER